MCAPVNSGRNLNGSHGIFFGTEFHDWDFEMYDFRITAKISKEEEFYSIEGEENIVGWKKERQ